MSSIAFEMFLCTTWVCNVVRRGAAQLQHGLADITSDLAQTFMLGPVNSAYSHLKCQSTSELFVDVVLVRVNFACAVTLVVTFCPSLP